MFGLFIIEAGKEPVALLYSDNCTDFGKPVVFDTGSEAALIATRCANGDFWGNGYQTIKVQPRRLTDDAWKARELGRFADGTYVALPWAELPALSVTAEHFAHVSTEDGAKIAYTQDATKGAGDIQTRVKPGKYLQQFYGSVFDAPTIARMAAEFSTQFGESLVLQFASTQDDIERVYINGPRSCMAYDVGHFDSSIHPCRIYAAGDLQLAYMERAGEITARALVWPTKKLWGRIYGDECRLTDLLETAGYESGELDGARMLRIREGDGFVCPYIDGSQSASDDGKFLIIGGNGVCGSNQNGLSGSAFRCDICEQPVAEDDTRSDDNGNCYCDDCYSERFGYCERYEEECEADSMREVHTLSRRGVRITQFWGERALENEATRCEGNREYYCNALIITLADGTSWSQDYFEDHGSVCDGDGEAYANEDMVQLEDGTMWSKDWFQDNGVTIDGKLYDKDNAPEPEDTSEPSDKFAQDVPVCA